MNKKYPGLHKILHLKSTACCVACFNDEMKPLSQCVVAIKDFNPSNLKQHIEAKHKDDMVGSQFKMDFQDSQGDSGVETSLFNTFRKPGAAVG